MPAKTKKSKPAASTTIGRKPRTAKQGYLMTRLEPDVAKDVRIERKRNGRTVQGEVNSVLRDAYASKWDNVSATPAREAVFRVGMAQREAAKYPNFTRDAKGWNGVGVPDAVD